MSPALTSSATCDTHALLAAREIPCGESDHLFSNGDDIAIEIAAVLGKDHDFLKHATFGFYFGTDYT